MQQVDITVQDHSRDRIIPVAIYLPLNYQKCVPVVIFNPGYQGQDLLSKPEDGMAYHNYGYLAEFFTSNNYAFISIQHDILGDTDGIEHIDPSLVQDDARRHLYQRGEKNILSVISFLKDKYPYLDLNKFVIAGHSNGGDIAKYFSRNYAERISHMILFDARRCLLEPNHPLKVLMFEANDTVTDKDVLPSPQNAEDMRRANLEWVIIKPQGATHIGYNGQYIINSVKQTIISSIIWFLNVHSRNET
jgi:pimeloyl-ACP methyl ester carboxylesterase